MSSKPGPISPSLPKACSGHGAVYDRNTQGINLSSICNAFGCCVCLCVCVCAYLCGCLGRVRLSTLACLSQGKQGSYYHPNNIAVNEGLLSIIPGFRESGADGAWMCQLARPVLQASGRGGQRDVSSELQTSLAEARVRCVICCFLSLCLSFSRSVCPCQERDPLKVIQLKEVHKVQECKQRLVFFT